MDVFVTLKFWHICRFKSKAPSGTSHSNSGVTSYLGDALNNISMQRRPIIVPPDR
jgi:hypothetical protein